MNENTDPIVRTDDVDGHVATSKNLLPEDVEGHGSIHGRIVGKVADDDDVEGHGVSHGRIAPGDDVDGHLVKIKVAEDDVEGHAARGKA